MKVAAIVQRYGTDIVGGAERLCRGVCEGLAERGHEVEVITTCAQSYRTWANVFTEGIADINGVMNLAPGGIGARMAMDLVGTGEIIKISREIVQPFYKKKAFQTLEWFREELGDIPCRIHKPEGALFLWLWFQELPCTSEELYTRLKARNTLIISGHHFFPGLDRDYWQHKHECIRVSYALDDAVVHEGVKVIADEVKKLYG